MTFRDYIWGIWLVTLLSLVAFVFVVRFVDPDSTGIAGKLLFYLSLFFVGSGIFNLVLLRLRKGTLNAETASSNIGLSFRQGMLLALFMIGLLVLQSFRVLVWWDGLLLFGGIFLIELYFVSKE
ncbi:MAG: hypothetical protein Q8L11_03800 [Candidatus Moranbacteria bacterium]|nr:hypothetical protein [Candidatus Moranbacteria bacterium]